MRQVIYILLIIAVSLCECNIHNEVDSEYFSSLDRVKGKNKPATPFAPVINACEGAISVKLSKTTDEDGDDLSYVIYVSSIDPIIFDPPEYYNSTRILAVVADIAEAVEFFSSGAATFYFWYTAHDGGRESDHSDVVSVSVPGISCP